MINLHDGLPNAYYRAVARSLARLAGAHRAGRLGPEWSTKAYVPVRD